MLCAQLNVIITINYQLAAGGGEVKCLQWLINNGADCKLTYNSYKSKVTDTV